MSEAGFLERHYDPELDPPAGSREELEAREVERIRRAASVVLVALATPRRLGGDATDQDLAIDKRRARRVHHALVQALRGWTKKKSLPLDDSIRREGAQLDWTKWREEHLTKIRFELRCLATWAIRNNEQRWGRSAVVRLENEIKWVEFALRD